MCMKTKMLAFVCLLCDPQRAALGVQPGPFAFIGVLLDIVSLRSVRRWAYNLARLRLPVPF